MTDDLNFSGNDIQLFTDLITDVFETMTIMRADFVCFIQIMDYVNAGQLILVKVCVQAFCGDEI